MRAVAVALALLTLSCVSAPDFDQLPPIESATDSELRIRIAHYPGSGQTAYVVRGGSIEVFDFNGSRWRGRSVETPEGGRVLTAALNLARLSGNHLGCGVADGDAVSIEGGVDGVRFAFTSSNPDFCGRAGGDEDARAIDSLLQMIEREAYAPVPILPDGVDDPCFTFESSYRGARMIRSMTPDRTVSRPLEPQSVVLQCERRGNRRVDCALVEAGETPLPLVQIALEYASELETCPGEPASFLLPMTFRD